MQQETLFDKIKRTDQGPASYSESDFAYLNRSARPEAEAIRTCLEEWLTFYPESEHQAFISSFRSHIDNQFAAAAFELYLHEIVRRLGYGIDVHPETPTEKSGKPDFRLVAPGASDAYLEATLCTDTSEQERAAQARQAAVYDAINKLGPTDFFLGMSMKGAPQTSVPGKSLRAKLSSWLGTLDADAVALEKEEAGTEAYPRYDYEYDGWKIEFRAMPKSPENRGKPGIRPLGVQFSGAKMLATWESLRDSIVAKGKKYGQLPDPLVLAVSVGQFHFDKIDAMQALFGQEQFSVSPDDPPDAELDMNRAPNGAWTSPQGPRYRRISAVLLYPDLTPWTMGARVPRLYHNPWANHKLDGPLCSLPQAVPEGDEMKDVDGLHPREILDLPDGWPE